PWGTAGKLAAAYSRDDRDAPLPHWTWAGRRGFGNAQNLALASAGAEGTGSRSLRDNPLPPQLEYVQDGKYRAARRWVARGKGKGWVQIELAKPSAVERIEWGRDRPKHMTDRVPVRYRIEVAEEEGKWRTVAGSDDRLPYGADQDERLRYRMTGLTGEETAWL